VEAFILDWRDAFREKHGVIANSSPLAPVTLGSLLTFSPGMKIGLCIILGTSAFAIGAARLEKYLAEHDRPSAARVPIFVMGTFMIAVIVGFCYLIIKNPLWRF
jgi:hypothetical protein